MRAIELTGFMGLVLGTFLFMRLEVFPASAEAYYKYNSEKDKPEVVTATFEVEKVFQTNQLYSTTFTVAMKEYGVEDATPICWPVSSSVYAFVNKGDKIEAKVYRYDSGKIKPCELLLRLEDIEVIQD